jgi:hypothetical protein
MQTGFHGFGRGAVRWAGHALGQVAISLAGTACLALLSNFYFNGPPATDAHAGAAAQTDLSSASLAAETFAPDAASPFAQFNVAVPPAPVREPEPAPKTAAAIVPTEETPAPPARQTPAPLDLHAAIAAAPPLRLTAMTNLQGITPPAAITNLGLDRPAANRVASGRVAPDRIEQDDEIDRGVERFTPRAVVHTVAAWGGWLTRLPGRF